MAKSKVVRFAFGNAKNPGSSVWRAVITQHGEVFINNAKEFGNAVHIAIHESGQSHVKYGAGNYYKIKSPAPNLGNPRILDGPVIYFDTPVRNRPPLKATGSTAKIRWLGWPQPDEVFEVCTYYCDSKLTIQGSPYEKCLGGPFETVLGKKPMRFYLFHKRRKPSKNEWWGAITGKTRAPQDLKFGGSVPTHGEVIQVARPKIGPAVITIEPFIFEQEVDASKWPFAKKPK